MALEFLKKKPPEAQIEYRYRDHEHHGQDGHDESNWLVSYADMMTLLCGFFIMLFSMAKLDQPQYEKVKEAVAKQFGGDYTSPTKEFARFLTQKIEEAGLTKEAAVRDDASGVSVVFESTTFFDTLSAEVKPESLKILDPIVKTILDRQNQEHRTYRVVVEGHTDSRPILSGAFPSNWELSGARASRVVRLLIERGFEPGHLTAIGYADTRPEAKLDPTHPEANEKAHTKNRRVVLRILDSAQEGIPEAAAVVGPAPASVPAQ